MKPWPLVGALLGMQMLLSWIQIYSFPKQTFVFTPLVDVVADGVPLEASEATSLMTQAKNAADARDIQKAYATLGSTFSLDDLLRGIEGLDDLTAGQRQKIGALLEKAKADHAEALATQQKALELESRLDQQLSLLQPKLPAEGQAALSAGALGAPLHPNQAPNPGPNPPPGAPNAPANPGNPGAPNAPANPGNPGASGPPLPDHPNAAPHTVGPPDAGANTAPAFPAPGTFAPAKP